MSARRSWPWSAALAGVLAVFWAGSAAGNTDPADVALNIIPSGQYGSVPPPPGADTQALMYDGLTPLFDQVTNTDLTQYFKSEGLGVGPDGPGIPEPVPHLGVSILRDRFGVPHVRAESYDAGIWAAGWIAAEDRGLLMEQVRYNSRVAAIDAPGISALDVITNLQSFLPSAQTEAEVAKQTRVLRRAGEGGRAVLRDIDTFIAGINDYLAAHSPSTQPWTRTDVYAVSALKNQFFGEGGGDEARRSQFLGGLQRRLGRRHGLSVFNDLRQFKNPELSTTIDGRFNYGHIPEHPKGSVVLDPGSFEPTPAVTTGAASSATAQPAHASNALLIDADHSVSGHPLMVGGPQVGYFYPGFTWEIDMHAPGLIWRGATSAPFPGYLLIGRGRDFATTLTSAGADDIDQYAETLCGGSDEMYRYKGKCRPMGHFDAGTLDGQPVRFLTTVHGPVIGYTTVDGRRVAISSRRASYGKDVLDLLFNRRLSTGAVHDPRSFFRAAAKTPQTFNSFYIDSEHIAEYTSGLLPIRPRSVDPGLPTVGTGRYEWTGFLADHKHPHGVDPRDGTMTNWNQSAALGFGAADNAWHRNSSAHRVDMLNRNLSRLANKRGKWSLASVTAAMNAAATQDVRAIDTVPLLARLLNGSAAPSAQAAQMLSLLVAWHEHGGSRLDRDLDGKIDDPGAAIMDAAWPKIADAFMAPQLGPQLDELNTLVERFDQPPGNQGDQSAGWFQYFDRDIRSLLGKKVAKPFENSYCGHGKLAACRQAIWSAIEQAGVDLSAAQGTADPTQWRADATAERHKFIPGILPTTIRYTNRPSGIQQVISFRR